MMITKYKNLVFVGAGVILVVLLMIFASISCGKSVDVSEGQIKNIRTMAQLCTVDLYSEVPVQDTINNKMLFGIQKQKGSVSFDLESLEAKEDGDTVRILLTPEIVEINEATDDNSWQVIDTKGLSFFTSDKLTDDEENQIKSKIRENSIKLLYHNGVIERARREAVGNLTSLMEKVYNKPVKVTDPTPQGAHFNEYQ